MSAGTKVTVSVRNNDVEFALRKFKNQVARNGNLSKAKERAEGYKKPGVRLKEEKKKGIATISSGNAETGKLIADAFEQALSRSLKGKSVI